MSRCRPLAVALGMTCSLALAACGSLGGEDRCASDSDCVLADPSCGSCGCPTRPMTKTALDAQAERCSGVEVRCAPAECPTVNARAACVNDRCVSVPLAPAEGG